MSDYNSSLPVRTENAGDVIVKIGDGTVPSQQLSIDSSGRIIIKLQDGSGNAISSTGGSLDVNLTNASVVVSSTDLDIRDISHSQDSIKIGDGTDFLSINNDGSINVVVSATNLDIRDLVFATDKVDVSGSEVSLDAATLAALENITVSATNLDIRDLVFATDKVDVSGSEVSLDSATLAALESITVQNGAGAAAVNIQDGGNSITVDGSVTVSATDLDIRDLAFATDSVDVSGSSVTVTATDLDIRNLSNATDSVTAHQGGTWTVTATATDLDIRDLSHSQDSVKVGDGTDFLAVNNDGSINSVVSATDLDIRDLDAAQDSIAAHLFDEAGVAFSAANPLPVSISADIAGDEVNNYNTAAAVAGGATSNHDYTVTAAKTLLLKQVEASGSGKMKIEVQIETGVASGVFNTRFVQFNSTADANMSIHLEAPISVAAGVRVRVIRTNRDNQAQDLYSTISGFEV
jgi:hypothetical protein